jgi:hypothetical protein
MSKAPPKPTPEPRVRAVAAMRRTLVDEYGDLLDTLAPFKNAFARRDAIAKTIRSWYADDTASASFSVEGDHYCVLLSPKGNQTRIDDIEAVYEAPVMASSVSEQSARNLSCPSAS